MRLRTIALLLALACSFTATMEAKHKNTNSKHPVKTQKVHKQKVKPQKLHKTA